MSIRVFEDNFGYSREIIFCLLVIREHDWVVLKSQVWKWKRVALVDCLEQSCSEEGLENSKDSGRSFFW